MKYAESTAKVDRAKGLPVTANFAPPPSDGDKSRTPDKKQPSKEAEPKKHDKKKQ